VIKVAATAKYNPEYHDDWAWSLAMKGATDQEIADAFGVSVRAINNWKGKHASFRKKMDEGKNGANARVETSLYRRAVGYEYEETESLLEMDQNGNQKPLRIKKVKKHIAPDTMAIMYWLNNRTRKSGEWTQKQDVNVSFGEQQQDVIIYLPDNGRDTGE
jgi:hypothetical protein